MKPKVKAVRAWAVVPNLKTSEIPLEAKYWRVFKTRAEARSHQLEHHRFAKVIPVTIHPRKAK